MINEQNVKVVSRKKITGSEFLSFDQVSLSSKGKTKTHFVAERVPTVSVFPITDNNEIYLISEYRYLFDKKMLESVAGTIDKGETPLACAKRELREEAGIRANHWEELAKIDLAGSYVRARVSLFLAKDLTLGEQRLEDDENITVIKLSLDEALKKVLNGEITISTSIIGIFWLDKLRKEKRL